MESNNEMFWESEDRAYDKKPIYLSDSEIQKNLSSDSGWRIASKEDWIRYGCGPRKQIRVWSTRNWEKTSPKTQSIQSLIRKQLIACISWARIEGTWAIESLSCSLPHHWKFSLPAPSYWWKWSRKNDAEHAHSKFREPSSLHEL